MTIKFPTSEFFENSGNAANSFNEQLRDSVATFACSLWSAYPGFITEGTNPLSSFARGFMNQACSSIQPAVPPPASPYVGGQCDTAYIWTPTFRLSRPYSGFGLDVGDEIVATTTRNPIGPISSTVYPPAIEGGGFIGRVISNGVAQVQQTFTFQGATVKYDTIGTQDATGTGIRCDIVVSESFIRADGLPDNCGSLPVSYPSNLPTSLDLTTNVTIVNLDGIDNSYNLVFNKTSNQYNFPMSFKLNGVNISLDIGGITIYGAPQVVSPTSGNDVLPPGSDGGDDGAGGNNDTTYPTDYPVFPDLVVPEAVETVLEYVVCEDGVLEPATIALKAATATIPYSSLIIDILSNILTDVCEEENEVPTVGLPDYYGVKPGVNRPAIVYIYKEFIGGKWQPSSYTSTVSNPRMDAIDAIATINPPDKNMGTFVSSISLLDGSKIKVSGDTEANAIANFNYLLNQVKPQYVPANTSLSRVISQYPNLQVKTVKCRQIEYYPDGSRTGLLP